MKRGALLLIALLVVALVATFAAQQPGSDSPTPSLANHGPRGLAVLETWLRESGADLRVLDVPLTELPPGLATLVLAAPSSAEVREDEVEALRRFVDAGGTLVYLAPRAAPQPLLNHWLGVQPGPVAPLVTEPGVTDVGGTTVSVRWPGGALTGVSSLRLSAERMIHVNDDAALEVAEHGALWWLPKGRGTVWLGSGADLAESARLELAGNARFWLQLPEPIAFDEFHHRHAGVDIPAHLVITGLQLAFLAGLFLLARARRLGPPRDPLPGAHRSTLDYVHALAALTRNAKVEPELVVTLKRELRRTWHERLGVPGSWSWVDAATECARRLELPAADVLSLDAETDFVALSRRVAELEQRISHPEKR